jgi:hypothetical protein
VSRRPIHIPPILALAAGEALLISAYLFRPSMYVFFGALAASAYALTFGTRTGYLLALVQVALTAGYASQRAMTVFSVGGLAFTPLDLFIAPALVMGVTSLPVVMAAASFSIRRSIGFLVALLAYIPVTFIMTWVFVPDESGIALRNLRSYLYLLCALAYAGAVIRGARREHILTSMNLASSGAAAALLAGTLGGVSVVGFETTSLVLSSDRLVRLGIVDEGLLPVLLGAALLSALVGGGSVRVTGLVAFPLLVAAALVSPGRGAIFTSCVVIALVLISHVAGITRPGTSGKRPVVSQVIALTLVAAVVVPTLSSALGALGRQGQDVLVIRARTEDALIPWRSQNIAARYNGWRAGVEFGLRSPVVGNGLGHTFPELEAKYGLDSPFNFPSTVVNTFAKAGIVGLVLWGGMFGFLTKAAWVHWRRRSGDVGLVALPMIGAVLLRGLSDDVSLSFQMPVIVGVIVALAISKGKERDSAHRVGGREVMDPPVISARASSRPSGN